MRREGARLIFSGLVLVALASGLLVSAKKEDAATTRACEELGFAASLSCSSCSLLTQYVVFYPISFGDC